MDPWDDVDPLEGEFGCKWWAQLPFSLSLSLRPTKDGLGMCQESGLAAATAVVVATAVVSIWNQRKSTWSFDCISDNAMPIAVLLSRPHVLHLRPRVVYLSPENITLHPATRRTIGKRIKRAFKWEGFYMKFNKSWRLFYYTIKSVYIYLGAKEKSTYRVM